MTAWPTPPRSLGPGEVHLWRLRLDQDVGDRRVLSTDEQLRADRFRYDYDRQHFIKARSGLRRILGDYLGRDAAAVEFRYGSQGKPVLADGAIEFNLSHSGDLALVVVASDRAVGVDVERIKPMADLAKLTVRFFTAGEHQRIVQLDESDQLLAFFRTWTCKEAYLKATGEGLSQLKSLEVAVQLGQPAQLVLPPDWQLQELQPDQGYVGAIAAAGRDWRVWCADGDNHCIFGDGYVFEEK
jgi:4'-phosphopantetheinyl transferase